MVSRSGKQVLIALSPRPGGRSPLWLSVHLRMTGRLIWVDDGVRTTRDHLRARISFDRGALLFYDTRRFGTLVWHRSLEATRPRGVEPLSPALNGDRFAALIGGSRQNIKAWLLRQDRLVGLGNIYASEILFAAGISPLRSTDTLDREECGRIFRATRRILRRAIRNCGTTFSDFQDARGTSGTYQRLLAVYGRAGEPCRRCGTPVVRRVQQQRSTFYCPVCQG
jgi:formamidopyrimidine-DNA glycosylase